MNYQKKKIKWDLKYKNIDNSNEERILYLDIEGKWIGYTNHTYSKSRINELRILIKDNARILNTTLFGSVKLY